MDSTTNQLLEKLIHLLKVNARDLKLVIASGVSSSVAGIGGTLLGAIIGGLIPNISQGINYRKQKNIFLEVK